MRRTMKKSMIFAAFAAALTLSSCIKEVKDEAPVALRTVQFNALPSDTKTVFGEKSEGKYPVLWQEGDKIACIYNFGDMVPVDITPSIDGTSASFSGSFADAASYQFLFISPSNVYKSAKEADNTVLVEFPSGQSSTAASPDPAAQILFANTGEITEIPNPVNLNFSHLSAYLHMRFTNVDLGDAVVQAVNVTSEDLNIAGRLNYNYESDAFIEGNTSLFHTISISTTTLDDVWCALRPVDFSGKKLTLVVSTDKGTFTKEVNLPASANLARGRIAKFTVDMSGIPLVSPVIYKAITSVDELNVGDKIILAAAGEDQAYAMSTGQNTNNRSSAGVTKTATEIINPAEAVEIIELEDGIIPGHFALKATGTDNPGYLYAGNQASSGSNVLKTQNNIDNSASWAISIGNVTIGENTWENASILFADIPSTGRGLIRFNATDKLFSAYGSNSSMQAVKIYRLDKVATSNFNVTLPNGNEISSSAQDVPVYIFSNVPWTASVTGDATLDVNSGSGPAILTVSVPENADMANAKTYTITVSTTDTTVPVKSFDLVLTQAKKVDTSGDPIKVYSFFLASAGNNLGSSTTYAGVSDIEIGGVTWNVTGVSGSSDYAGWRLGGKSITNTNRSIFSKTAIPHEVTKVVVSHSRKSITINSFTLSVHSSAADAANGANPIATFTQTVNVGTQDVPAINTFEKADATSWAGCFYRITYNVTNTGTSNKYVEFRGLEMWGYSSE